MSREPISICIPAYNNPKGLGRALESIAGQTFTDFEIIISDDSLGAELQETVGYYMNHLPIKYYKNQTSLKVPGNWNHAVSLAKYELIKVIHHDDWLTDKDSLRHFSDALSGKPGLGFAFCATEVRDVEGSLLRVHRPSRKQVDCLRNRPHELFFGNFVGAPSATLYRRTAIEFDMKLVWDVDWEFYMSYINASVECYVAYIDIPLIATEIGSRNSMTHHCLESPELQMRERIHVLNKYLPLISNSDYVRSLKSTSALAYKLKVTGYDDLLNLGATVAQARYIRRCGRLNYFLEWVNAYAVSGARRLGMVR